MRRMFKFAAVIAVMSAACALAGTAMANQVTEGQVVSVKNWTLTVRTASNETLAFNPYWVKTGQSYAPAIPVRNILPALEAGETVRVEWTLDERENRKRIDSIEVISAREGVTKGVVVSSGASELVVHPQEKEGTVRFNTKWVQINGKWVPDPEISSKISKLPKDTRVTVRWAWDQEGRKRITGFELGW